ncbi:type II toxin-antitoxin system VapC family toxin [uncultured Nostoc sp.]|uniref:type II toxin-antitoxin system VapC family toxin n=1 Tax=uncultured Nostoc sp. TaxID=340711 RepID=UPI0035CA5BFC
MTDADLLLEYLLYQTEAEELMEIIKEGKIQFFITDVGLSKIREIASRMDHPEETEKILRKLLTYVSVCSVDADLIEKANLLNFKDFESALEVTCACANGIGAVVTRNRQNFDGVKFNVLSTSQISVRQYLENLLLNTKLVSPPNIEVGKAQGLNPNIPPIVFVPNISDIQYLEEFLQNNEVSGAIDMQDLNNSKLKKRISNAIQAGAMEAARVVFDHPLIMIPLVTVKAFMDNE